MLMTKRDIQNSTEEDTQKDVEKDRTGALWLMQLQSGDKKTGFLLRLSRRISRIGAIE